MLACRESGVLSGGFYFPSERIKPENLGVFKNQIVDEVRAIPGIDNAAAATNTPLSGSTWGHGVDVGNLDGQKPLHLRQPQLFRHARHSVALGA